MPPFKPNTTLNSWIDNLNIGWIVFEQRKSRKINEIMQEGKVNCKLPTCFVYESAKWWSKKIWTFVVDSCPN
jgi:hypothetical protein